MIGHIDDFILDRFQEASDFIHSWTGLDCIHQARACALITAWCWLRKTLFFISAYNSFDIFSLVLAIMQLRIAIWETPWHEIARQASLRGFRNPLRLAYKNVRLLTALLIPIFFSFEYLAPPSFVWIGWMLFWVWCRDNLECCDVQAPRPGKIREFLRGLGEPKMEPVPEATDGL